MGRKALTDLRVLDFTRFFAGPFCTMLLGDLGADVVKVEGPGGDPIRRQGPPFFDGESMGCLAVNRNKRSIALDMKSDNGKALAHRLALVADVIVENFRPGVMSRFGLDYAKISMENPRVVYASISGMGADGPDKDAGAFDLTIQAEAGYMSITGSRDSQPVKLGTSAFDLICGQYAMGAIVTALYEREHTGRGQKIDTSLLESAVTFLADAGMEYLVTGHSREKFGSEHASLVPYKAFQTADGWIVVGAGIQNLFERFMSVLGRDDLTSDPRFLTLPARVTNREALYRILDGEVRCHPTETLIAQLRDAQVPCAPVNNVGQALAHRQCLHRGMVQHISSRNGHRKLSVIGAAVKYSAFGITDDWCAPPKTGEDTDVILHDWLGIAASARV